MWVAWRPCFAFVLFCRFFLGLCEQLEFRSGTTPCSLLGRGEQHSSPGLRGTTQWIGPRPEDSTRSPSLICHASAARHACFHSSKWMEQHSSSSWTVPFWPVSCRCSVGSGGTTHPLHVREPLAPLFCCGPVGCVWWYVSRSVFPLVACSSRVVRSGTTRGSLAHCVVFPRNSTVPDQADQSAQEVSTDFLVSSTAGTGLMGNLSAILSCSLTFAVMGRTILRGSELRFHSTVVTAKGAIASFHSTVVAAREVLTSFHSTVVTFHVWAMALRDKRSEKLSNFAIFFTS